MLIRYNLTLDDVLAFNRYHMAHSPSMRRQRWIIVWGFPLLLLLVAGITAAREPSRGSIGLAIILPLAFHLFFRLRWGRGVQRQIRKMYSEGKNADMLGEQVLELLPDGLFVRSPLSETKLLWPAVERVESTDAHLFIYTSAVGAHVIPRSSVLEGDFDEFKNALLERYRAAVPPQQPRA